MNAFNSVRRAVTLLLFSLWWGGFTFYAARVVFIGHEVLRSRVRQGFITERVTNELNSLALVALAFGAIELRSFTSRRRLGTWLAWIMCLGTTVTLMVLHTKLGSMLDFESRQVFDDAAFYRWHRIYLLTATVQWLAGGALLIILSGRNSATS